MAVFTEEKDSQAHVIAFLSLLYLVLFASVFTLIKTMERN